MIKPYEEMRNVNVRPYCDDRDGLTYLNWAKCIDLLHQNGASEVYWEPIPTASGSSVRMTDIEFKDKNGGTNRAYETRIKVVIDDKTYEYQSPVMNGANPVKDNSMSQQRVWNSMCRAFVKCVAIHTGLGFDLWLKEEAQSENSEPPRKDEPVNEASLKALKEACHSRHIDLEKWSIKITKTEKTLPAIQAAQMLRALTNVDPEEDK